MSGGRERLVVRRAGKISAMVAPLRARDFRRYYAGQTASAFGDSLTPLAIAFAVLHLTGSPMGLGIVVLATRLPIVALTLLGGAVGDRFPRRTVMLTADLVRFAAHGVTAVLLLTGHAQLWLLVVLQVLAGVGTAFFNPAAAGLITSLAAEDDLQAANSLISISRSRVHNVVQTTVVQRHLPADLVARAYSVTTVGALVAAPLGTGLAGPAAELLGTAPVLLGCAAVAVLLTVATLPVPAVWRVRDA